MNPEALPALHLGIKHACLPWLLLKKRRENGKCRGQNETRTFKRKMITHPNMHQVSDLLYFILYDIIFNIQYNQYSVSVAWIKIKKYLPYQIVWMAYKHKPRMEGRWLSLEHVVHLQNQSLPETGRPTWGDFVAISSALYVNLGGLVARTVLLRWVKGKETATERIKNPQCLLARHWKWAETYPAHAVCDNCVD